MDIYDISGPIYPAKTARLELIDILKEQMSRGYQPPDRASITRPVLERVVADLEHAVQLLDALQEARAAPTVERLRALNDDMLGLRARNAELVAAAKAFEAGLSELCDGPERDALRAALAKAGET